jgi:glycolate oxidase FAD binding subunit
MTLRPSSERELSECLASSSQRIEHVDLSALNRLIEHTPEDMSATVEAGMSLAQFQSALAQSGQWLPLDPPHPAQLTIAEMLSTNASGPRRFGYGTARDWVIGLKTVLGDGRVIQSGGKVVKNVAGYDLPKLFIGAQGTLGVIIEATFKLRPKPAREAFVEAVCETASAAARHLEALLDSDLAPVVVDLHNEDSGDGLPWRVIAGFDGEICDVEWQLKRASDLGLCNNASLEYEDRFWALGPARKISVLPSKIIETAQRIKGPFVARAGNGILFHRDQGLMENAAHAGELSRRVKKTFDPKNILPEPAA